MERIRLTYVFDAYCGWCYGFGPALRTFVTDNASRLELRILSGGLFVGPRALPVSAYPHIPAANARISALTGVTFGEGYERQLVAGTAVMDSADAAVGLAALREQAPERVLDAAAALQRAWYIDGQSLSDPGLYAALAKDLGYDAEAVTSAFASARLRRRTEEEFAEAHGLGVDSYPTLLLHTPAGVQRLGGPVSSAPSLSAALDLQLNAVAGA